VKADEDCKYLELTPSSLPTREKYQTSLEME
jgi:hypothetical protein